MEQDEKQPPNPTRLMKMKQPDLAVCNKNQLWTHDGNRRVEFVAMCNTEANAARLALAWNLHSELVNACRLALDQFSDSVEQNHGPTAFEVSDTIEALRSAIAKATSAE